MPMLLATVWLYGGLGIIYLVLLITTGVLTIRNGHWVLFILGIFLPLLWIIGAIMSPKTEVLSSRPLWPGGSVR